MAQNALPTLLAWWGPSWLSVHPDQDQHCSSRQFFCTLPAAHECLLSALVSWALLDFLISFAHWTMSSLRAGVACSPLNLHHLARCSEHSRSSNHFYWKNQWFLYFFFFFLVSLLDCIKHTEMDLFQQDWHIRSNWFIPNKSLIGLPNPSKTLPIILLCE